MLNKIRADQLQARKDRDAVKASLLTTLIGEAAMVGKNAGRESTDAEVIATVKKFIKNAEDTRSILRNQGADGSSSAMATVNTELAILGQYLPSQLEGAALRAVITDVAAAVGASTPKDMGKVMAALKAQYDGKYDGKAASALVKEVLQ